MNEVSLPPDAWRYTDAHAAAEKLERMAHSEECFVSFVEYVERSHAELFAVWREANPEGYAESVAKQHRYRARSYGVPTDEYGAAEIQQKYEEQRGLCFYCQCVLGLEHTVDHMTPFFRGGHDTLANICVCCAPCNRSKFTKTAEEYLALIVKDAQPALFYTLA